MVVNRKPLLASSGDTKPAAMDEQIKSMEKLVASAAGLEPARGDKVTVVAVDFAAGNEFEPAATSSTFWDQIAGQSGNTLIAAAIVLSTIIFVSFGLRPSLRLILENRKPALEAAERAEPRLVQAAAEPALEADAAQIAQPALAGLSRSEEANRHLHPHSAHSRANAGMKRTSSNFLVLVELSNLTFERELLAGRT